MTVLLLVLALVAGCRASGGPTRVVIRDSAGVAIIDNRGGDLPLPWVLDSIATIGGAGSPVEMNQLTELTVDADTLGHIFVLDSWFGHKVQLLDTMGTLVRTLTREGSGPGEIGNATSISASADGTISVMDFSKTGLVRIRWDGLAFPILRLTGYNLFGGARAAGDTVIFHTIDYGPKEAPEQIRYRTSTDTATLASVAKERLGRLPFCRGDMEGLTRMLAPDLRYTARGGHALVSRSAEYMLEEFEAGHLIRIVRRDVAPVAGTVAAVRRFFPDGKVVGSADCIVQAGELVAKRGVAPVVQPVRRLAIDLQGRIWAERNTFPDEASKTDVFERTGRYLGTMVGLGAPLGFPSRDLLVVALPDSTSTEPRLRVYRRRDR